MIMEADPEAARALIDAIAQTGGEITGVAGSWEEARQLGTAQRPQFILLDASLLQKAGEPERARRLAEDLQASLVCLGTAQELRQAELDGYPPFACVPKPLRAELLERQFECMLSWHRALDQLKRSNESLRNEVFNLVQAQALAGVGSWSEDLLAGRFRVSGECLRIHGLNTRPEIATIETLLTSVPLEDRRRVKALLGRARRKGRSYEAEYRVNSGDGPERLVYQRLDVRRTPEGRPAVLLATVQDITERRRSERALRESEARTSRLLAERDFMLENSRDVLYYIDRHGMVYYVSPAAEQLTGYPPEQWKGHFTTHLVDSERNRRAFAETMEILRTGREYPPSILEFRHRDGRILLGEVSEKPIFEKGEVVGIVGVARDVTERIQAESRLRQAAAVFENTREAIIISDAQRRISAVNRAFSDITGYAEEEIVGQGADFLAASVDDIFFREQMWQAVELTDRWAGELWCRRRSGEVFPAWASVSTIRDDTGNIINYVNVLSDLSHQKESEEKLDLLAHYDPLTHLPNRLLFTSRLEHAIRHAERRGSEVALLFIDLDHFKKVNDTLGHPAGDRLLQEVGERLTSELRKEDTIARLGGDEFVIIVDDLQDISDISDIARKTLESLSKPYRVNGNQAVISASIGISIFPRDGRSVTRLVQKADMAMYRAKEVGRANFQFCTAELTARAAERLTMENAMRRALIEGEFVLYYQPQVSLSTGRVVGVEALLRWHHPERGLVPPAEFIPLGEEAGLIGSIGAWALKEACAQVKGWESAGIPPLRLAVNISACQLARDEPLVSKVASALEQTGFAPHRLELELTESAIMRHPGDAARIIDDLKSLGLSIAIDDFGKGYSSMSYLKRFTIDKLKTDRGFIQDLPRDESDRAITGAIVALGHSLHMTVLAEGVETREQEEFLREQGCDEMQGFLFSPPLPERECMRFLSARRTQ